MKYIELSVKDTEEMSKKLADKIKEDFKPDLVVFVSRGSFMIGKFISKYFEVPLIEIYAIREGNSLKDVVSPILKIIPRNIKKYLRKKELESGYHNKNSKRKVFLEKGKEKLQDSKNILLVDDSVDTGNTAKQVCDYIIKNYADKMIKFACFNYFRESEKVFKVDYSLFQNYIIIGPWSKDSKYYREFLMEYSLLKQKEVIL